MNEIQHQQNHVCFKGNTLNKKDIKYHLIYVNHVNRISDTDLLFIMKLGLKNLNDSLTSVPLPCIASFMH